MAILKRKEKRMTEAKKPVTPTTPAIEWHPEFPAGMPKEFETAEKSPETLAKIRTYVATTEYPPLMQSLAPMAIKDVAIFITESGELAKKMAMRVEMIFAAVAKAAKVRADSAEKAEAAAESLSREIITLAENLIPKQIELLKDKMLLLPVTLKLYSVISRSMDSKTIVVTNSIARDLKSLATTTAGKTAGKRGRESKWSEIKIVDSNGVEKIYADLKSAAMGTFSRPSDQSGIYSAVSFEKKAVKGYGCKSVTFVEKPK